MMSGSFKYNKEHVKDRSTSVVLPGQETDGRMCSNPSGLFVLSDGCIFALVTTTARHPQLDLAVGRYSS